MGLEKTSYNLIYNTDGSLCTTIHEDDVPFEGVKSFAVEEGTENAFDNVLFTNGTSGWGTGGFSDNTQLTVIENGGIDRLNAIKVERIDGSYSGAGATISQSIGSRISLSQGEKVTVSWYVKGVGNTIGKIVRAHIYATNGTDTLSSGKTFTLTGEWQRISYTLEWTYDSTTTSIYGYARVENIEIGDYMLVCCPQIEKKPFATSFVDGTRPSGKFSVQVNLEPTNALIDFCYKIPASITMDSFGNRVIGFSDTIPNFTDDGFLLKFENSNSANAVLSVFERVSGTTTKISDINIGDVTKWRKFTIRFTDSICSIFLDGTNIFEYTHNLNPSALQYINIPDSQSGTDLYLDTLLISNLYIGKAKDDGNLVWTDEFIQEVYNARKPFKVPEGAKFI